MRRRVSGATPNVACVFENEVIVRHVPLTEIESPSAASCKIGEASIVRFVPFGVLERSETAIWVLLDRCVMACEW